ncbi:hypothetical protein EYE40_02615 [Glaciihabitans arcticus]|uniref:Uncharacterized protein n=1 Tax=Glaciihabitans arcticus TaxID=2668039 RepID=A0A4Q9GS04_9MICO|nr:maleylpyruvate isomerase N-terminal domain-containing protein [Glaciihabitans arcticus]TBN56378.1 hypothetical protein EYE40_02615 [Glaciihabitans arcticus]
MSDLSGYFPLSQRPKRDETAVTNNWAKARGTILLELAGLLGELDPADWELPGLRPGWTVRDVAGELVWLAGSGWASRASRVWGRSLTEWSSQAEASERFAREQHGDLAARLHTIAVDDLAPNARRSVRALSPAVVAAFELSTALGRPIAVDSIVSGAVALARGIGGPVEVRAVTSVRTLVATDADWRVGRGPELPGTAAALVLFLFGRSRPPE